LEFGVGCGVCAANGLSSRFAGGAARADGGEHPSAGPAGVMLDDGEAD